MDVREGHGREMAWDTPLCLPPALEHDVNTNQERKEDSQVSYSYS